LRITHDLRPQRCGPGRDHVNDRLHVSLGSARVRVLQWLVCAQCSAGPPIPIPIHIHIHIPILWAGRIGIGLGIRIGSYKSRNIT
jgi:hypothetical protein